MKSLKEYKESFESLKALEQDYIKSNRVSKYNKALSNIMTDMERDFNIPMVESEEYNSNNREVIELYRDIADSRVF
jgi:hypothetical protein